MDLGFILLACAVIVVAAVSPKPAGWAALGLAVVGLLVKLGVGLK
jgi:hypothetical protein